MEPELEDGEVKFCPDCNMLLDPFLTYCPNCGTLARVRQIQAEPPRLMLSRYAIYVAGGLSFMSIFVNFIEAMLVVIWFNENGILNRYRITDGAANWLAYGVIIFFVVSILMGFVGTLYGYEAAHRRWNSDRLRSVVFSARLLTFLGSLNLLLGFVFQSIQALLSKVWATGASVMLPLFWATGAFMILLSLPGLIIATRLLKREETKVTYVLG